MVKEVSEGSRMFRAIGDFWVCQRCFATCIYYSCVVIEEESHVYIYYYIRCMIINWCIICVAYKFRALSLSLLDILLRLVSISISTTSNAADFPLDYILLGECRALSSVTVDLLLRVFRFILYCV